MLFSQKRKHLPKQFYFIEYLEKKMQTPYAKITWYYTFPENVVSLVGNKLWFPRKLSTNLTYLLFNNDKQTKLYQQIFLYRSKKNYKKFNTHLNNDNYVIIIIVIYLLLPTQ